MKQLYKLFTLGLVAAMPSVFFAQLNGVYTIDNTQPSSATNYTSFTQFANAINTNGVNGPVTVNVGGGLTYTEQVNFIAYSGASAANSVVVNGNGRTLTFNATSATNRHTLMLSGADFMTWNNLIVIGTHATNALVVHLWNDADNNTFNNCRFEAPNNGTSTTQVPFSISGSSVAATTSGDAGSNNTVNSCTVIGGYYSTVFYGRTTSPFNSGNQVKNSLIRDFYLYGFYNYYCTNSIVEQNVVDRLNRTTVSTTYGIFLSTNTTGAMVERNHVRSLFPNLNSSTSTCYGIYCSADATATSPNRIRNNVVSDIEHSGTAAGLYLTSASYAHAEHNTVSLDYSGSTAGTTYGIYCTGPNNRIQNNMVTIARGGTGTKYGLYYSTAVAGTISDYNNVYVSATAGANYFGDLTASYNTLAAWQAGTGYDLHSTSFDPQYASPATFNYAPTNLAVNNKGLPIGIMTDFLNAQRSPLAPDQGAYEIYNSPCNTAPPANVFATPSTSICPNSQLELTLLNTNTYTNSGYIVQWYSSTLSTVGGFSAIPGATLNSYVTAPLVQNIHYYAVVTCSNTNQSSTTPVGSLLMVPLVQDTVPYYETFEVQAQNNLPNCYWSSTNPGDNTFTALTPQTNNRVPRNGNGYAYFSANPSGTNYFFTNGVYLKTGITYSAAIHYITENVGVNQWADLSIMYGSNQSPAGLQTIASISPVTGQLYNLLSNTFSVATTGYYYIAIRATSGPNVGPYLTLDDLSVTIPCSLNSPTLAVLGPKAPVCQGTPVNLVASGANAYVWSNGVQGPVNVVAPPTNSTYIVTGINTLSRCSADVALSVIIKNTPVVSAFANHPTICAGQSTTLTASGADNYYWTSGFSGSTSVVSPTLTTSYLVAGTNTNGCSATAQIQIIVNQKPALIAGATATTICKGDAVTLIANGASTYTWLSGQLFNTQSSVTIIPQSSAVYTVTGADANGCTATEQVLVLVDACTGLAEAQVMTISIFPNPATDVAYVSGVSDSGTITLTDVSGRVIMQQATSASLTTLDLSSVSAGVYYIKVQQGEGIRTEKLIRQ